MSAFLQGLSADIFEAISQKSDQKKMHNISSGLDTQGFGKPIAVGVLWEAWQGSFCRDSFSFLTVE